MCSSTSTPAAIFNSPHVTSDFDYALIFLSIHSVAAAPLPEQQRHQRSARKQKFQQKIRAQFLDTTRDPCHCCEHVLHDSFSCLIPYSRQWKQVDSQGMHDAICEVIIEVQSGNRYNARNEYLKLRP